MDESHLPPPAAQEPNIDEADPIYVANAGQVLAAPYLIRLFDMLGLTEGKGFGSRSAAERAVHLLQFMVDGPVGSPENILSLNKVLCGIPPPEPINQATELSAEEMEVTEGLLANGIIPNWTALGNTSVSGLRQSFLQREGRLQLGDHGWNLLVEQRSYDMLLDQLPWSISTIHLAWMDQPLFVEWRR